MDGITRKRMQCDSHIAKIGYFGWKKVWRGTGEGRRSMYRHSGLPPKFFLERAVPQFGTNLEMTVGVLNRSKQV